MPKFEVSGTRYGERPFTAPVWAEDEEDARERFMESVKNPEEFEVEEVGTVP